MRPGHGWIWQGMVIERLCATQIPNELPTLNKTWTATFLLTLINTTKLYSWCSVQVEKEGIQVIVKTMGSVWRCVKTLARFPIYGW
jgi:hypothetical protein